jgi:hypothetical protein
VQDGEILDSVVLKRFDETPPNAPELLIYSSGHQLSDDSSIA